ncbi:MAG: MFS transporter, partial [Chloroflexota bacterium]
MNPSVRRAWWRLTFFAVVMLVVEFMDEFAYSSLEAARPLIRDAFALSYVQVGLITTLPVLVAILVEPFIGLFADTGKRRLLIVGGGVAFGAGLVVQGLSPNFAVFLLGATLQAPASGVFVNLAQASLMDEAPTRRENRMAWWTLSGSLAVVVGPLTLTAMLALGSGWRALFIATGVLSVLAALWITWLPDNRAMRTSGDEAEAFSLRQSVREAGVLLRRGDVWRWLVL